MKQWNCCVLLLLFHLCSSITDEHPVVKTELGTVKGYYKYSYDNRLFAAFEGIPYAKPPIGILRFEEPEKADPWSRVLDATVIHECAQHVQYHLANANEDCLYINVYVPRMEPIADENLDVIVHIHEGVFMLSSPSVSGPEFLMDKDVVYVNFNYRLGVFGFLSTGDDVVPGNNGLKDQVLALEWVKSNIQYFGGNPNSVTLAGVSSGGTCVHLHYFSSLSKGLFHRGISHSGTALSPWTIYVDPLQNAEIIAESVGCTKSPTTKLLECLKTKPASVLAKATYSTYKYSNLPVATFAPVIEKPSKTAFLTENPYELLKRGELMDVPWITTITAAEGLLVYFFGNGIQEIMNKWSLHAPYVLNYFYLENLDKKDITTKITKHYFDNLSIFEDGLIQLVGDRLFKNPMQLSVQMQSEVLKSPVYTYLYTYQNEITFLDMYNFTGKRGSSHGSDGLLIYDANDLRITQDEHGRLTENDEWMKSFLVNIITTFANDSVPKLPRDVNWEPVTSSKEFSYLNITDKDHITIEHTSDFGLRKFWCTLNCDHWNKKQKIKDEF